MQNDLLAMCCCPSSPARAGGGVEDQHQVDAPLWQGGDRTHLEFDIYSCYRCFTPSTGRPSSPGWGGKARSRRKRRRIRPGSNKYTKQLWEKSAEIIGVIFDACLAARCLSQKTAASFIWSSWFSPFRKCKTIFAGFIGLEDRSLLVNIAACGGRQLAPSATGWWWYPTTRQLRSSSKR